MKTVILIILAVIVLIPVLKFVVQWSMKLYLIIRCIRDEKFAEYVIKELKAEDEREQKNILQTKNNFIKPFVFFIPLY